MGLHSNLEINSERLKGDGEKLTKVLFKLFKKSRLIEMIALGMRCKENEYYVYHWTFSVTII